MLLLFLTNCTGKKPVQAPQDMKPAQYSSYSISGIITSSNGKPIEGVVVSIVSGTASFPEIAAVSNDSGAFSFDGIENGKFTLKAFRGDSVRTVEVEVDNKETNIQIKF
jgi:Carboxypeptidase regulatory-like domain